MEISEKSILRAKTVLLVEDDEALMAAISKLLERYGVRVLTAQNGAVALPIVRHEPVDLVLTDIQMPQMNGVELTREIKKSYSIPVVLMTAFSDLLESKEAAELGADAFFPKPFDSRELIQTLQGLLSPSTRPPDALIESPEEAFFSLSIEEFAGGRNIPYPIFLRIFERKFIQIAHRGEDLDSSKILYYKNKDIRLLYLRAKDFCAYVGFYPHRAPAHESGETLLLATKAVLENEFPREPLAPSTHESISLFITNAVRLLCEDTQIQGLLRGLHSKADFLYAHSVSVSGVSVLIARQLGWALPHNLFKVATGGMLHDVGETDFGVELLSRPRTSWKADDHELYQQHSDRGFEAVRAVVTLPEDVLQVIRDHHENCLSTGFPSKLGRSAIHPLAKLIAVADDFCSRVLRNPRRLRMSPEAAIHEMLATADAYDTQFFRALMSLYKFDPPESFRKRAASNV